MSDAILWDGEGAIYSLGDSLVLGPGDCCCLPPSSSSGSSSGSGSGTSGSGSSSGSSGSSGGYPCEFNEDCLIYTAAVVTPMDPSFTGCPPTVIFESFEEATQYCLTVDPLLCFCNTTPHPGYCCDGQCSPTECPPGCYYCDTENDPECSNPLPGCEEGKTCINDICV